MEKAYELKALGQYIKEEAAKDGLHLAEEAVEKLAKAAYRGTKRWAKESAVLSPNKVDDVLMLSYDFADQIVEPAIEKLDLDGDGK
ncbi:MAG: hypothetical protein J7501_09125 [Bdellovibrio sp.]|nr:hypothetical protein [Bdellovibrio sp.]